MDANPVVHLFGLSDIGNHRFTNEDAWWAGQLSESFHPGQKLRTTVTFRCAEAPVLAIVSDGVGGANAGEVASEMAVTHLPDLLAAKRGEITVAGMAEDVVRTALHATHAAIKAGAARPATNGMCATVSLLCLVAPRLVCWGQAGDSRIYRCRHGRLEQLTRDHSPVGRMRHAGLITEAEARRHPQRHQIDQSLGDPINVFAPEVAAAEMQPADVYLLCSDGLSDGLWDHEIERILAQVQTAADVQPAAEKLIAAAKGTSGRDNITGVVLLIAAAVDDEARDGRRAMRE